MAAAVADAALPATLLLTPASVGEYLVRRGVCKHLPDEVAALGGGVSNIVLAVRAGTQDLVVKQSLPRLNVPDEWLAKRERALNEAAALRWAGALTPAFVPVVRDVDTERCALVLDRAPRGWRTWKDDLMEGVADPSVAQRLGAVLRLWHDAPAPLELDDQEAFVQLRIDPYHRTVAKRHEDLAVAVHAVADGMLERRVAFVHGDFSPKNVLVGGEEPWVIDFEVGHLGDPAFDVAFLLSHLVLKGVHVGGPAFRTAGLAFLDSYGTPPTGLVAQVACLLLARVDGKSPAEYLTAPERAVVREHGRRLLAGKTQDYWLQEAT